ncbi:MAG: hypothetical protein WCI55_08335 [Armatimonadota bacterium]
MFQGIKAWQVQIGLVFGLFLIGCGNKGNPDSNSPVADKHSQIDSDGPAQTKAFPDAKKSKASESKASEKRIVKSFSFSPPTSDWVEAQPTSGDETYTLAKFKSSSNSWELDVTSIGLPAKGANAVDLVKKSETEFAQGIAANNTNSREWIKNGFSISRYTNPSANSVSTWCISETCKVRLNFTFPAGSKTEDIVKQADSSIDAFFDKNPTGGAKTK